MSALRCLWRPQDGAERLWPAWRGHLGLAGRSPGEDLGTALLNQFCRGLWTEDPIDWAALQGPALFLANHQVAVESILFCMAATPFLPAPMHVIAKAEHADSWVGQWFARINAWPGIRPIDNVIFTRIGDAAGLLELLKRLQVTLTERRCGLLVHVAASRVLSCRDRVRTISSVFIDLALNLGIPVVPVKFRGGLPVEPLEGFIDFPAGYGAQDYVIGRPIPAAQLAALPYPERRALVLERINALGGDPAAEQPSPPDPRFKADLRGFMARYGVLEPALAAIWAALIRLAHPSPEIAAVLRGIERGTLEVAATPEGRWSAALAHWLTEGRMPVRIVR